MNASWTSGMARFHSSDLHFFTKGMTNASPSGAVAPVVLDEGDGRFGCSPPFGPWRAYDPAVGATGWTVKFDGGRISWCWSGTGNSGGARLDADPAKLLGLIRAWAMPSSPRGLHRSL